MRNAYNWMKPLKKPSCLLYNLLNRYLFQILLKNIGNSLNIEFQCAYNKLIALFENLT